MQKGLSLIFDLRTHKNPLISEWAAKEEIEFEKEIEQERAWEKDNHSSRDERFE
jgi:hypothetical protein